MDEFTSLFTEVADALGVDSVSIIEKDHYIVELLQILKSLTFETHQLIFAGGTALAKAGIALNRMSEDVDIKLVPQPGFLAEDYYSRAQRKNIRKEIVQTICATIISSGIFTLDDNNSKITSDEYRYNDVQVRYPQRFAQVPCLRPFIKLELIETELLELAESRNISSLVTELTGKGKIVSAFPCATIASTQAEKLVAILRRTASVIRNLERKDDQSLVRHLYDNYCIVKAKPIEVEKLTELVKQCIEQDIQRYGNQYPQFKASPVNELKVALDALEKNPVHQQRYQDFVSPMLFGSRTVPWTDAYDCFRQMVLSVLAEA